MEPKLFTVLIFLEDKNAPHHWVVSAQNFADATLRFYAQSEHSLKESKIRKLEIYPHE